MDLPPSPNHILKKESTGSPMSLYWIPSIARVNTRMNVGLLDPLYSQGQYMDECRSTGSPMSLSGPLYSQGQYMDECRSTESSMSVYWIPSIARVNTWMNVGLLNPLCRPTGSPL
jgi:hypothetical protein